MRDRIVTTSPEPVKAQDKITDAIHFLSFGLHR